MHTDSFILEWLNRYSESYFLAALSTRPGIGIIEFSSKLNRESQATGLLINSDSLVRASNIGKSCFNLSGFFGFLSLGMCDCKLYVCL